MHSLGRKGATRRIVALAVMAGLCGLLGSRPAQAGEPPFFGVLGQQIFTAGGDVTVTILTSYSGFSNAIYLFSPGAPRYIGQDEWTGASADLGIFKPAQELVFGIQDPDGTFVAGPGERNPDGLTHGSVSFVDPTTADIGFEDLPGPAPSPSDRDFNDAIIRVSGVSSTDTLELARISAVPAPEPSGMSLLGLGAIAGLFRRRRR
jgi:Domain of unknown function (DUF4114)/PEP-CTERM motif